MCLYICRFGDHESLRLGLLWWLSSKEFGCNVGDMSSIPGLGRSPGGGNGSPLQYSCQENSIDSRTWGLYCKESDIAEVTKHGHVRVSDHLGIAIVYFAVAFFFTFCTVYMAINCSVSDYMQLKMMQLASNLLISSS